MTEAMLVFLPRALAALILKVDATAGAAMLVIRRALYLPAYLSGVTGRRSVIWMAGVAGMVWIALAVAEVGL